MMTFVLCSITVAATGAYRPPGAQGAPASVKLHEYEMPSVVKKKGPIGLVVEGKFWSSFSSHIGDL